MSYQTYLNVSTLISLSLSIGVEFPWRLGELITVSKHSIKHLFISISWIFFLRWNQYFFQVSTIFTITCKIHTFSVPYLVHWMDRRVFLISLCLVMAGRVQVVQECLVLCLQVFLEKPIDFAYFQLKPCQCAWPLTRIKAMGPPCPGWVIYETNDPGFSLSLKQRKKKTGNKAHLTSTRDSSRAQMRSGQQKCFGNSKVLKDN